MTSTASNVVWILVAVILAKLKPAAATRELSSSPTADTSQDTLWQWLKITAVPLGVFLMGACIWGCIKNSTVWRSFLNLVRCERRGVSSIAPEADAMPAASPLPTNSSQHGPDLEEGNAASHLRMGDDPAISTCEMIQEPPFQSANDDGNLPATDDCSATLSFAICPKM